MFRIEVLIFFPAIRICSSTLVTPVKPVKPVKKEVDLSSYPYDSSPKRGDLRFSHPYPGVQDSGDFAKDYVKDENSDDGQWEAQSNYDAVRIKYDAALRRLNEAAKRMTALRPEFQDTNQELIKASRQEDALADKLDNSIDDHKDAVAKVKTFKEKAEDLLKKVKEDGNQSIAGDTSLEEAVKNVEERIANMEECERKLLEAKEQLEDLLKDRSTRAEAESEIAQSELSEAIAAEDHLEENINELKKLHTDAEDFEKKKKKEFESTKEDYMRAISEYEAAYELKKKLEHELSRLGDVIENIRRSEDPDGGVTWVEGSGEKLRRHYLRSSTTMLSPRLIFCFIITTLFPFLSLSLER